ncbi:MAG: SDR family oxidoreductase [Alphaproteobacteria bacterium]
MSTYQKLSRSIKGSAAIVTGAASGMGRATAILFAEEGCDLALFDLQADALEAVAEEARTRGVTVLTYAQDLKDQDAIKSSVADAGDKLGRIDIVVNNAGFAIPAMVDMDSFDDVWDLSMAVMLTAQKSFVQAALPFLRQSDNGRIVNVASTEGLGATKGNSAYVAAKHGVIGLTRALAVDLGPEGITVNAICPGPIHTGITEAIPDEHKTIFAKRRVALKRYGIPEEVANITLSVVLPAASFLTGAAIPVDGGVTIKNA